MSMYFSNYETLFIWIITFITMLPGPVFDNLENWFKIEEVSYQFQMRENIRDL